MIIHKSFSKTDLIDIINTLNLKIVFSHQDNKKDIQNKIVEFLSKPIPKIEKNFYHIENKDGLIIYLMLFCISDISPSPDLCTLEHLALESRVCQDN